MENQDRIFRQAALDKLSSPEQLDQLMQVATPKSWLALAAFGVLLLTALTWGIFDRIPVQVHARGILIKPGGVYVVTARGEGAVLRVRVRPEQVLTNGQMVATMYQPELRLRIDQAEFSLKELRRALQSLIEFHDSESTAEAAELEKQRENFASMIQDYDRQIVELKRRVEVQQGLLTNGLISEPQLLETKNGYYVAQHDLARVNVQLKQLRVQELQAKERRRQQAAEKTNQIVQAEQQLALLTNLWNASSQITTPYPGVVLEIAVKEGQLIAPNTPVLTLQAVAKELEARLYLSPADGKQVTNGMDVALSPVSAKKEEYGLLRGKVNEVSLFPATPEGMMRVLGNSTLVNEFMQGGSRIEVRVALSTNANGGFQWTSKAGESLRLSSGTPCEGTITTQLRRPISLVLPILRPNATPATGDLQDRPPPSAAVEPAAAGRVAP